MYMKMRHQVDDSPDCTASCVARCGRLAELPRTEAIQLVGCFEETCGCRNKWSSAATSEYDDFTYIDEDETDLMKQYFDLIHNQERVEYLMLQQNVLNRIVTLEQQQKNESFLSEGESIPNSIKQKLNSAEGMDYYESYLG